MKIFFWKIWINFRKIFKFKNYEMILFKHSKNNIINKINPLIAIQRITFENVDNAICIDKPSVVSLFRQFLSTGDWGYFAYLNGQIIHRSWVKFTSHKPYTWDSFGMIKLSEKQALIHFCRTSKVARGMGAYSSVLIKAIQDCYSVGINEIFIATTGSNIASIKGIIKAGFFEVERKKIFVLFGIHFYWPRKEWQINKSGWQL